MIVTGKISNIHLSMDGRLRVTFEINEKAKAIEELEKIKDCNELQIEAKKYRRSRSLTANAYLWKLLDLMAKTLGTDKDTMYLLQLSKYGVFNDLSIKNEAIDILQQHFKYIEILDEGTQMSTVRVFYGSSTYDTKQMSELIDGTVRDAKEIGVETLPPREVEEMLMAWKGKPNE